MKSNEELEQILKSKGTEWFKRKFPSRWDGSYKQFTKNCEGCPAYKKIDDDEICLNGWAWKRLMRVDNPRKCQYH
jgi:hypothetical protein